MFPDENPSSKFLESYVVPPASSNTSITWSTRYLVEKDDDGWWGWECLTECQIFASSGQHVHAPRTLPKYHRSTLNSPDNMWLSYVFLLSDPGVGGGSDTHDGAGATTVIRILCIQRGWHHIMRSAWAPYHHTQYRRRVSTSKLWTTQHWPQNACKHWMCVCRRWCSHMCIPDLHGRLQLRVHAEDGDGCNGDY